VVLALSSLPPVQFPSILSTSSLLSKPQAYLSLSVLVSVAKRD
jgi:hypothetical protein